MTFAASLAKTSGKRPVWLYRFIVGNDVWHVTRRGSGLWSLPTYTTLTGAPDATFVADVDWSPVLLDHGKIGQSTETARQELEIAIQTSNAVCQSIIDYEGSADVRLDVWQVFEDDPDLEYSPRFSGRVRNYKTGLVLTKLFCDDGLTDLGFNASPAVIQQPCRHCHYFTDPDDPDAPGCRLDPADFQSAATVSAIDRKVLTIAEAAGFDDGEFTYGLLIHGTTELYIVEHVGNQITIEARNVALETALLGGPVAVFLAPGCDGSVSRCNTRFSNILNHGGFPLIKDTPFDGRSIA